jgi:putative NADPH-quinone reductase
VLRVAALDFPLLRSSEDWHHGEPVPDIRRAQEDVRWAELVVIVFPLWLGDMPALLKGFLEQVLRPGFALPADGSMKGPRPLAGRRAHVIVTMGMPAPVYRFWFGAHAVRGLRRNVLAFCGMRPVRTTCFGAVESGGGRRERFLARVQQWGREAR